MKKWWEQAVIIKFTNIVPAIIFFTVMLLNYWNQIIPVNCLINNLKVFEVFNLFKKSFF